MAVQHPLLQPTHGVNIWATRRKSRTHCRELGIPALLGSFFWSDFWTSVSKKPRHCEDSAHSQRGDQQRDCVMMTEVLSLLDNRWSTATGLQRNATCSAVVLESPVILLTCSRCSNPRWPNVGTLTPMNSSGLLGCTHAASKHDRAHGVDCSQCTETHRATCQVKTLRIWRCPWSHRAVSCHPQAFAAGSSVRSEPQQVNGVELSRTHPQKLLVAPD